MVEVPAGNHTITCTRLTVLDGSHIFLRAKWFNTSFSVTAMDFPSSWSCHVVSQEIREIASMLGIDCEEFFSQARLYLGDGIPDSQYSFEALGRRPNVMRLSWTTADMRFSEEPRVALFLQEDSSPMELVPEFFNVLMDSTLILKDRLAKRKITKSKKARQLAMRFSSSQKVRKRSPSPQAPTTEGMLGQLDTSVVKSEFPNNAPKFNSSTASYEPASGLSTPTHPSSLTALDGIVQQHELRTPAAMENLISPRQVLQSVSSTSKLMNLGVYNAGRLVSEEETVPCYSHQTPAFSFERPNGLGSYVGVSHGQLKSLPSGYQGISENKREQAQADAQRLRPPKQRSETVQVPMIDDRDYILDRVGSSQLQLSMKAGVYDGLNRVPPPKHSEFAARLYEHGPSSWAQPRTPSRTMTVDIDSMRKPAPTLNDVAMPPNVHNTPVSDKANVLSHESKKLGMATFGSSGWINPRKSSTGVESRKFELSGSERRGASQEREGVIDLSDSEEEEYHNLEVDPGVFEKEDLLDRRMPRVMEGLLDEPEKKFTIRAGRLNDSMPDPWQGNIEEPNMDVPIVKDELCQSRLEAEAQAPLGCGSRSLKRKDRNDAHEDRSGPAGAAACIKAESECQSEQNTVWQSGDHRYGKRPNTLDYRSRAHGKPAHHTAAICSEKFATSFNYENRAQWNTWISEAKTEVTSWEAQIHIGNSMTGGSGHVGIQPTENVSPPCDSKHLLTPLSLKKLNRDLDVTDFPRTDSEHLQSPREPSYVNLFPSEEDSCRERLEMSDRGCAENAQRSRTRELDKSKIGVSSDVSKLKKVKMEREFMEVENDGDSDSVEEHVFEPGGLHNDTEGIKGAAESVADMLKFKQKEKSASLRPLYGRKLPGRRGRPPGVKAQLHPELTKSMSQGANTCIDRSTHSVKDPGNTNSQRVSRTSKPLGRPKHSNASADVDKEQQRPVPDSDYYNFDGDRVKEKIKANEVWALYHEVDFMPRSLIRIKEVSMSGAFWVKASWLQPHSASKKNERQKESLNPRSCGNFEEVKETRIFNVVNCFSHRMHFTPKLDNVIQVYPQKGEVWAFHKKEDPKQGRFEKTRQGRGMEENVIFRLVVILSNSADGRPLEILVLRKRTGYRTLWEPGYERGSLPMGSMERFSHKVPAYKLTEEDYPDLKKSELWDIDAAAVPESQSKVT